MNTENKKKLKKDTIAFAVSNIFTKLLQLLIVPLFTYFLTTSEFGQIDLITSTVPLLIAISSIAIVESVFRFSVGKENDNKSVFTIGFFVCCFASILLLITFICFKYCSNYSISWLVYGYAVLSMFHNVFSYFIKGLEKMVIFVIDSIIYAVGTCLFVLLLFYVNNQGIETYYFGYVVTIFICICFMIISTKLWRYFSLRSMNKEILVKMLKYSAPLVVNSVGWWMISLSDKYITNVFLGDEANGILAISHKFPTIISVVYGIFGSAFQILAITGLNFTTPGNKENLQEQYENMLSNIILVLAITCSIIITLSEPYVRFFVQKDYYDSWRYVSIYVFGSLFFSMSSFYGYIYNVVKKNVILFISTLTCGVLNIVVCCLLYLIPSFGLYPAAISTCLAYFIVFIFRYFHSRKYLAVKIRKNSFITLSLLLLQVVICVGLQNYPNILVAINCLIFVSLIVINVKNIIRIVKTIFTK